MEAVLDYTVIVETSVMLLNKKVKEQLKAGWVLQGGVSLTDGASVIYIGQAMIKINKP